MNDDWEFEVYRVYPGGEVWEDDEDIPEGYSDDYELYRLPGCLITHILEHNILVDSESFKK